MPNSPQEKTLRTTRRIISRLLLLLVLACSLALGCGIARAVEPPLAGTVDPVESQMQLGQQVYLENCATCHIGIPPAILPTETWQQLLQDPSHYGVEVKLLVDPFRILVWNYLRTYSRSEKQDEETPYRIASSRYFKALHPRVKMPATVSLNTCVSCHPGAKQYNFRSLTPEWQNSP